MSSYTNIFIEYKDSRDNDWHLLRAYVPLEDREWDRTKSQEELEKENAILKQENFLLKNQNDDINKRINEQKYIYLYLKFL